LATKGGIPLAALRADLEGGWPAGTRWTTSAGVAGAILEQPVGTRVAFRIHAGDRRLRLTGSVLGAGADGARAKVRASLAVLEAGKEERAVWQGSCRGLGGGHLRPTRRLSAGFEIADEAQLLLAATGPAGARVLWRGIEIGLEGTDEEGPFSAPVREQDAAEERPTAAEARPRFSILTPVHDPPVAILEQTIDSVLAQSHEDWELCLVDDGSHDPRVRETLRRYADGDPRVRLAVRETAGGIAAATNAALEMAGGEFVALLDHDDLLLPDALAQVDEVLRRHPDADMAYSDEEMFEEGGTSFVFAKPHWSPDLLRSQMYTCHLGVYRHSLAVAIGGFRSEFDGSQDFDFALRFTERSERVVHIPRVLYRWRAHLGSAAADVQAKPAAYPAARRAIAEHLRRTGVEADVHFGPWQGVYRVVHRLPAEVKVAVALVGEDNSSEALERLASAATDDTSSGAPGTRVLSAATPAAALEECADTDVVILCDGAVEPLTRFWLARLAGFAWQAGVAAVGAKTLAPDGRVERGALAVDRGLPLPLMYAGGAGDPGPLGIGLLPANVAAVDGVVAVPVTRAHRLGGLGQGPGNMALADYCLRADSAGLRVVFAPDVLLRRTGGHTPANDLLALNAFRSRWAREFPADPYFDLSAGWPGVE